MFGLALVQGYEPIARASLANFSAGSKAIYNIPADLKEQIDARVLVRLYEKDVELQQTYKGGWATESATIKVRATVCRLILSGSRTDLRPLHRSASLRRVAHDALRAGLLAIDISASNYYAIFSDDD